MINCGNPEKVSAKFSKSNLSGSGERKNHAIFLSGKCEYNVILGNIMTGYSEGIAGDNLIKNTVFGNISNKKHTPDFPNE
jgi:hypothetical protein